MDALTEEEMNWAKSFCGAEKKVFWLCIYQIALNKHRLPFMMFMSD